MLVMRTIFFPAPSNIPADGHHCGKSEINCESGHPGEQQDSVAEILEHSANLIASCRRDAILQIGETLYAVKKKLGHGKFTQFLAFLKDKRVAMSPRMAELHMKVFRAADGRELAALGIAKAALLLPFALEQRARLVGNCPFDLNAASVAELRAYLKAYRTASAGGPTRSAHFTANTAQNDEGG
jgi:hypothetical protein